MNLLNKIFCFLILGFLSTNISLQAQSFISTNRNINNLFYHKGIFNLAAITQFKNTNPVQVLDSVICIFLNEERNKISYSYNDDLSLNYFTIANWYNNEWINSLKHTSSYNSDGNLESVLWESFDESSGEWLYFVKDVYDYDSSGNLVTYLYLGYNGHDFENVFRYQNYYNIYNKIDSTIEEQWDIDKWINDFRITYTYDSLNLEDTILFQDWNNGKWVNQQMNIYRYDEKPNVISNLTQKWQGDNWVNFSRGNYKYDVNNNCLLEDWEIANNNNWENWVRIFYEFDVNNNLIHLFGEEWINNHWVPEDEPLRVTNPDGTLFVGLAKELFLYYSKPTNIENEKNIGNGFNLQQNYPNPFNPTTSIQYTIGSSQFVTLKVYDILGNEVVTLVNEEKSAGSYEVKFSAKGGSESSIWHPASGIYFYQLRVGDYIETKKMILLK